MDNIMEILDKLQFFGGQRAGRELWADKPTDVQEADIDSFNENIEAIRDYIKQLEAKVPRWISMEERHPKYGEEVLICEKVGKYKMLTVGYLDEDGCFYTGEGWFAEVTHWMPLPEPPKEPEA